MELQQLYGGSPLEELLEQYAKSKSLPEIDELLSRVDGAVMALEHMRGGVRDFTKQDALPLVVVPDLHGRRNFLLSVLHWHLPKIIQVSCAVPDESVLSLLEKGLVRVVCVGDLFHSEMRGKERWLESYREYQQGNITGRAITEEMCENLRLLQMVTLLQLPFSDSFVFLKGNHENILNRTGGGDFAFRKFAEEGAQVRAFMTDAYGSAVLEKIWQWEQLLPLSAVFNNCVVTHAEPVRAFTRDDIESMQADVVAGLTWTRNDEADDGSVQQTLCNLLGEERASGAIWLSGHRPVEERFALRQNGKLVQIHNPFLEQVAVVHPGVSFNPAIDIYPLAEGVL